MTRPLYVLAFLAACLIALPASASAPRSLDIGGAAQVWFQENHTVPMVAVSISLPAGSAYDPENKPGMAAFAASLLNEGAGGMTAKAYQAALANRAIQISITPDRDDLTISVQALKADAPEAFRLLALALAKPRFDADAIQRVRAQMLENLEQEGEDPGSVATRRFFEVFFGHHPYAHSPAGTVAGLNAITAADLHAFARSHWVRGGIQIAAAGDIDAASLTALLKSTFDPLSATAPPPIPRPTHLGAPGTLIIPLPVPQPNAVFGLPGMLRSDPDYLAGYVANYIVGGGDFSARLTSEVREKRGLTYGISTAFGDYRAAGYMVGQVATRRESMAQSLAVIRDVFRKFAADGPTAQELADAKTYLTGSYPLAFSSNVGIAAQLNAFERAGLPLAYVTHRNAMIDALTLDDVRRAARRAFDPTHLTVVVAGSIGPATPPTISARRRTAAHS